MSRTENSTATTHNLTQAMPRSHPWDPNVLLRGVDSAKSTEAADDNEFMTSQSDTATRNSVIVRFKGNVEVTLTPLLLEGLQR